VTGDQRPPSSPAQGRLDLHPAATAGAILLGAIAVQMALIAHVGERVYGDVLGALSFGRLLDDGTFTIHSGISNSKTFLGPLLWFRLYQATGILGLKLFNVAAFAALFWAQYRLGKGRYETAVLEAALLLLAFYVGTTRNVTVGEPDDNASILLFTLGVLAYLDHRRAFAGGLLMGGAFLFKFWAAIFFAGFALALLLGRRWRDLASAAAGMLAPFVLINLVDEGASADALRLSLAIQRAFSSWSTIGLKMLSTGMLPVLLLSAWMWWRRPSESNTLAFAVAAAYSGYVVMQRDAHAASFAMVQVLVFASLPIAEVLLHGLYWHGRAAPRGVLVALLATYVGVASLVSYWHLYRDSRPVALLEDRDEALATYSRAVRMHRLGAGDARGTGRPGEPTEREAAGP
jgi:hypothetical protein